MWSTGGVFIKVLTGRYGVDPRAVACLRSATGGLVLAWALPRMVGAPKWRTASALVAYTLVMGAFVVATTATTAANAIFLQYAYPLFAAIGAVVVFRERLGLRTAAALAVGMAGIATILVGGWEPGQGLGMLYGFSTAFALATFTLLQRSIKHHSPIAASSFYNLAAALLLLPLAWGRFGMSLEAFLVLAAMGILQISVPYVLFIQGLKTVPAAEAALITLVEPILNPVWVWLAVGEEPGRSTLVGGALILVALVVCFLKPTHQDDPERDSPDE
jgi:drug/metabolite transporter (DMT)-like permease